MDKNDLIIIIVVPGIFIVFLWSMLWLQNQKMSKCMELGGSIIRTPGKSYCYDFVNHKIIDNI